MMQGRRDRAFRRPSRRHDRWFGQRNFQQPRLAMSAALLLLVFAAGQWLVPVLPRLLGFGVEINRATATAGPPPPELPSGQAFAIWGLLFSLSVLYGLRQALPSRRDGHVYQRIRGPALMAFAASCAWMATAQFYGNGRVLVAIIWVMLAASFVTLRRLMSLRATLDGFDRWVTLPLFGMLSGWLTAAVALNTISWLKLIGAAPAWSTTALAAVLLAAVGLLALVLLRRAGSSAWYAAGVIWALGWVAHANLTARPNREIALLAIGLALILVSLVLWERRPVRKTDRIYRSA
jgi:hypothetical protein